MSENIYRTISLTFAAYLLSTHRLKYIGCEGVEQVVFKFEDPNNEGEGLLQEFETGPIAAFYSSLKALRRVIDSQRAGRADTYTPVRIHR